MAILYSKCLNVWHGSVPSSPYLVVFVVCDHCCVPAHEYWVDVCCNLESAIGQRLSAIEVELELVELYYDITDKL